MRARRLILALFLAIAPAAFPADAHRFGKLRETYQGKLADIVKQLAGQHADLARWCETVSIFNGGASERDTAVALDPSLKYKLLSLVLGSSKADTATGEAGAQLSAARLARVKWMTKSYLEVAAWCRTEGMEIEFLRTARKLLRFAPQDPEVRKLFGQEKHEKAWLTAEQLQIKKGQRYYRGQWRSEAVCAKSHASDLERCRAELSEKHGLELKAANGPCVDVFYTVADVRIQEELPVFNALFERMCPSIFPTDLKEPLRVLYVGQPEEYRKLGQDPAKPAVLVDGIVRALDTGKGPAGIVRELGRALLAAHFKKPLPGWLSEGFAFFLEAARRQELNGGVYLQVGYVDEAQAKLLPAFKAGTAPSLSGLVAKTEGVAGETDRACGQMLLCWLMHKRLLDPFLVRCRTQAEKKTLAQVLEDTLELPLEEAEPEFAAFAKENAAVGILTPEEPEPVDKADVEVKFDEYGAGGK